MGSLSSKRKQTVKIWCFLRDMRTAKALYFSQRSAVDQWRGPNILATFRRRTEGGGGVYLYYTRPSFAVAIKYK